MISRLQKRLIADGRQFKDIAVAAGFKQPRLSDYVHGRRVMPMQHLISLCEVLHCNPDDLIGEDEFDAIGVRIG